MAKDMGLFLIAGVVLLVAWVLSFVAFHVTTALIHILLLAAVISFIVAIARRAAGGLHRRTV